MATTKPHTYVDDDNSAFIQTIQTPSGSTPTPDPTVLTTQNLRREISGLRELIEARLDGMDKAMVLLHIIVTEKFPATVDDAVGRLESLHNEKFNSIKIQFAERDTRTEQTSRDSKVAVDAALQAAKEAVGEQNKSSALAIAKSEASTTKQIDQIGLTIGAMSKGFDDKIVDLKDRVNGMENRGQGQSQMWGYVVGAVGILIAIASVVIHVATFRAGA